MGVMDDLKQGVSNEVGLQARNVSNIPMAVDQKFHEVTGDQTSPWDRVGNTLKDTFGDSNNPGVLGKFKQGLSSAKDSWDQINDPVKTPNGPRPPTQDEKTARILRAVQQSIGAFMSILSLSQDMLNMAFADLTAPLAAIMPSLPASPVFTPWLGIPHTHTHPPSLVPPAPPIPLPGFGVITTGVCVKVMISGLPAARAGDYGMNFTCGSLTPVFEVFTGSSNVFIGGKRAARIGDIGVSCKPSIAEAIAGKLAGVMGKAAGALAKIAPAAEKIGKALAVVGMAGAVLGGASGVAADIAEEKVQDDAAMAAAKGLAAAMDAAQLASDLAAMALGLMMGKDPGAPPCIGALLFGVPNVLIGGFPMVNIPNPIEAILSVLGAFKPPAGKAPDHTDSCGSENQPINLVTGAFFDFFRDFELPGPPTLLWKRYYDSRWAGTAGPLGFGYRHEYQWELQHALDGMTLVTPRNERIPFPPFAAANRGVAAEGFLLRPLDQSSGYVVTHHGRPAMTFQRQAGGKVCRLVELRERDAWIRLSYDNAGLLTELTDSQGRVLLLQYDARNRIAQVCLREPGRQQERMLLRYEYSKAGNLIRFIDGLGASGSYEYDGANRMIRRTDRRGYAFFNEYDGTGRCVREWGEDGLWDGRVRYLPEANCAIATYADGATTTVLFDDRGVPTDVIDPCGRKTKFVVGPRGQVEKEVDSLGNVTRWLYDSLGACVGRLTPLGYVLPSYSVNPNPPDPRAYVLPRTSLEWEQGRLLPRHYLTDPPRQEDPLFDTCPAGAFNLIFHSRKNAVSPASGPKPRPQKKYDPLGRLVEEVDEEGHTQKWKHDAEGNILEYQDRDGSVTRYTYKSWNLLHERIDPMGHVTTYDHSIRTAITRIKDPGGNVHEFIYDDWDRLIEVCRHGRTRERYRYDAADNLLEKTDGEGRPLLSMEILPGNLKGVRQLADGPKQTFAYDERGRITLAATETFQATFAYDRARRLLHDLRDDAGIHHEYTGPRLRQTRYIGQFVVSYAYPRPGVVEITDPVGGTHRIRFGAGGLALRELSSGRAELTRYDARGKCLNKVGIEPFSKRLVWHWAYRYSAEGDLLEVESANGAVARYRYDAAHRLIEEASPAGRREFGYDPAGNLHRQPGLRNVALQEGNRLARANEEVFEYNARNHISSRKGPKGTTTYRYDAQDMLVACAINGEPWTAEYDPLCRRIAKTWRGQKTTYYWDDWRLAAEERADGSLRLYVYADELALVPFLFLEYPDRAADPSAGEAYFIFTNQIGVPIRVENDRREVVWEAQVNPYGQVHVRERSTVDLCLRFPGHYYDPETGLHYNRFRFYDPILGRYLQSDPKGINGGLNLYAYSSTPLSAVDLDGLADHDTKKPAQDGQSRTGQEKEEAPVSPGSPLANPEEIRAQRLAQIAAYASPEMHDLADAFRAGDDVHVGSKAEAEQVLLLAYPDAVDCGRSGPPHGVAYSATDSAGNVHSYGPSTEPIPYDQTGWSGTNPNGQYHTDYDENPAYDPNSTEPTDPNRIYGHDMANPHGDKPHINVKRPDGSKGTIFVDE